MAEQKTTHIVNFSRVRQELTSSSAVIITVTIKITKKEMDIYIK